MKSLFLIPALVLVASTALAAQDLLPDPMTCGSQFNQTVVFNEGSHTTKLKFSRPGSLTYATDMAGPATRETLNGANLTSQWHRDLQLKDRIFFDFSKKDGQASCEGLSNFCAHGTQNILNILMYTQQGAAGANRDANHQRALACAQSIVLSFMNKSLKSEELGYVGDEPLMQLSSESARTLKASIAVKAQKPLSPTDLIKKSPGAQ